MKKDDSLRQYMILHYGARFLVVAFVVIVSVSALFLTTRFIDTHNNTRSHECAEQTPVLEEEGVIDPGETVARLIAGSEEYGLLFEDGRIKVLKEGATIFSKGVVFCLLNEGKEYCADTADWTIVHTSEQKVIVSGQWEDLPGVRLLCRLSGGPNTDLLIDIFMEADDTNFFQGKNLATVIFPLDEGVTRWDTVLEGGEFSEGDHAEEIFLRDPGTRYVTLLYGEDTSVSITANETKESNVTHITYPGEQSSVIFDSLLERSDESRALFSYFRVRIGKGVHDLKRTQEKHLTLEGQRAQRLLTKQSLVKNDLFFYFDQGQGRFMVDGKELTTQWGLYTALLVEGTWYTSRDAVWDIRRYGDDILVAKGLFSGIPVQQVWILKAAGHNVIELKVALELFHELKIDEMQVNMLAGEPYVNQGIKKMSYRTKVAGFPARISFKGDRDILCSEKNIGIPLFYDGEGEMLQYRSAIVHMLKTGIYDNYFEGEIDIDVSMPTNRR